MELQLRSHLLLNPQSQAIMKFGSQVLLAFATLSVIIGAAPLEEPTENDIAKRDPSLDDVFAKVYSVSAILPADLDVGTDWNPFQTSGLNSPLFV